MSKNKGLASFDFNIPPNSDVVVFTTNFDNEQHWSYLFDIALKLKSSGGSLRVIDLQKFIDKRYYGLTRGFITYTRKRDIFSEAQRVFSDFDIKIFQPNRTRAVHTNIAKETASEIISNGITADQIAKSDAKLSNIFLRSSLSKIISMVDHSERIPKSRYHKYLRDLACEFDDIWESVSDTINNVKPDYCIVHNGRVSHEAAILDAARKSISKCIIIEHGGTKGEYYRLAAWEPHDRINFQEALFPIMKKVSTREIKNELHLLHQKITKVSDERFIRFFEPGSTEVLKQKLLRKNKKIAVLFTNSPDELVGMNPDHYPSSLADQYDEMHAVVDRLIKCGFHVIVRVHPNIANKGLAEIRRVREFCKKTDADIVSPLSVISSYDLGALADLNIVWRSTIGIELTALGFPVLNIAPARYDKLITVKNFWAVSDDELRNGCFLVDANKSLKFIAASKKYGHKITRKMPKFKHRPQPLAVKTMDLGKRIILSPLFLSKRPYIVLNVIQKLMGKHLARILYNRIMWSKVAKSKFSDY